MADWAKEIMKLANDLCLDTNKTREVVNSVEILEVPQGKKVDNWKYDRAWTRLKPLIMAIQED